MTMVMTTHRNLDKQRCVEPPLDHPANVFAGVLASVQAATDAAARYSRRIGDATGATAPDRVEDIESCRQIVAALAPADTMMIELARALRAAIPPTGDDQDDEGVLIMLGGHLIATFRAAFGVPQSGFEDGYSFVDSQLEMVTMTGATETRR